MNAQVNGIHHVTAIAGDPQTNVNFYAGILGLQFVKKTVNFDDPFTYHFYFGDESGQPGSLITFFPWSAHAHRGRAGTGQISAFAFSIPHGSVAFWEKRFRGHDILFDTGDSRFGEEIITATDPDGCRFTLVAARNDSRNGREGGEEIPAQHAIRGIHSVTLSESDIRSTSDFLISRLGFQFAGEEGNRHRFLMTGENTGTCVDILHTPGEAKGTMGTGITHHVAFRAPDDEAQLIIRDSLAANGVEVTPVIDRTYFRSVYFNEPGGTVLEIATDGPGFLIDEPSDQLGTTLKLPPQYEAYRSDIEQSLPPVSVLHMARFSTQKEGAK
jgi:glyoxalase family protein